MISISDLRTYIMRPTLLYLEPEIRWTRDAEELSLLTAAQESQFYWLDQTAPGPGPGYGIFQEQENDHDTIWHHLEQPQHSTLMTKVTQVLAVWPTRIAQLRSNWVYACIICRLHYFFLVKAAIPSYTQVTEMARYYKQFYNTPEGKATVQEAVDNYNKYVVGVHA